MAARHRLRLNTRLIVTRYLVITGVGFLLLQLIAVSKVNRLPFPSWIVQSAETCVIREWSCFTCPPCLPVDNELHLSYLRFHEKGFCIKSSICRSFLRRSIISLYDTISFIFPIRDGNLVRHNSL